MTEKQHEMGFFERYLTLWVGLCIGIGILLGIYAPDFAKTLDAMSPESVTLKSSEIFPFLI